MATTASPPTATTPRRKPATPRKPARKPAPARTRPEERYVLVPLVDRVRDAVVRVEREVHGRRRQLDRRGRAAGRSLGANLEGITDRVENVVQNGFNTGMKLVNGAQGRISKAA